MRLLVGVRIVQLAQSLDYGLVTRGIAVQFQVRIRDFSFLQNIQTRIRTHAASYTLSVEGAFLGGKAAGA